MYAVTYLGLPLSLVAITYIITETLKGKLHKNGKKIFNMWHISMISGFPEITSTLRT